MVKSAVLKEKRQKKSSEKVQFKFPDFSMTFPREKKKKLPDFSRYSKCATTLIDLEIHHSSTVLSPRIPFLIKL